jgi:hypothetical protein
MAVLVDIHVGLAARACQGTAVRTTLQGEMRDHR